MKELKYLNCDEQIALLKEQRLNIGNESFAKKVLCDVGYYKLINGYKRPFKFKQVIKGIEKSVFYEEVTFEDLYHLFKFDLELAAIVFEATTNIEIKIKALLSDLISSNYGVDEKQYLNKMNFAPDIGDDNEYTFDSMKNFIHREINNQIKNKHESIIWYRDRYSQYPFWVITKILTLGTISKIFSKLKESDKIVIAKKYKIIYKDFEGYLEHVCLIRNVCAHNDVLYSYKSKNNIPQKNNRNLYKSLNIEVNSATGRYQKGSNDFLSNIIIFKLLLDSREYNNFKTKIKGALGRLKEKMPKVSFDYILKDMGLNCEWSKIK